MRFRTLLALSLCLALPVFSAELKGDDEEDTLTVYKMEVPAVMPKDKPDADDVSNFSKNSKNKKLMDLRTTLEGALRDVQTAGGEPDEKKRKRAVEKSLSKVEAAAKKYYKELLKTRKKPLDEYTKLKKEKELNDRKIQQAEENGDDKQATRLAQQFDRKNSKYEALQKSLAVIDSFIYFDEIKDVASIVSDLELKPDSLPEILSLAATMKDDKDKDKAVEKDKAKKKADLGEDKGDDGEKGSKKSKKKKSRKKADDED